MTRTEARSPDTGRTEQPPHTTSPDTPHLTHPPETPGRIRIAAVGDLHFGSDGHGAGRALLGRLVEQVEEAADVLVLCGDLTTHGSPQQAKDLLQALGDLTIPTVAVLGNHDHDAGEVAEVTRILCKKGVQVLDGEAIEMAGVGFAGAKGFAGGFGRATLGAFGEPLIKAFVQEALDEALKLENALRKLATPLKVALLHYAPIADTIEGEPPEIQSYLGTSRLLPPIETMGVDVVFHGHAHTGRLEGRTPGGVPVFNVALPLLQQEDRLFHLWEAAIPAAAPAR